MPSPYRFLTPAAINAMGRLPLLARTVVEGFITGLHTSPFHGFSVEFTEHRKYTPGDPLRDLDWVVYGRTDRYYIKRYREETNLRCRILLDASASMGFASQATSKLEYACRLAACLAYLAIRQRDAVGLTVCHAEGVSEIPPAARPAHLGRIMELLETTRAGGNPSIASAFHETAERMRRRGLVIAISDLLDPEEELIGALRHLRHRHHDVILFHLMDPAEEELPYRHISEFVDMETGESLMADPQTLRQQYREAIGDFRQRYRRACSDSAIDYMEVNTAEPFTRLLWRYLVRRSRA